VPVAGDGERGPAPPAQTSHRQAGPAQSGPSAPGCPPGSRCSAGGPPGRTRPAPPVASPADIPRSRQRPVPLHPNLTNYC
jgi:hypothetical protein